MEQQETGNNVRLKENSHPVLLSQSIWFKQLQMIWIIYRTVQRRVLNWLDCFTPIPHPAPAFIHVTADATDTVPLIDLSFMQPTTLLWGVIFLQSPSPPVCLAKCGTTLPDQVGPVRVTSWDGAKRQSVDKAKVSKYTGMQQQCSVYWRETESFHDRLLGTTNNQMRVCNPIKALKNLGDLIDPGYTPCRNSLASREQLMLLS